MTITERKDGELLAVIGDEITARAQALLVSAKPEGLNPFNEMTRRADCLRLLRAAIELAPIVKP